MFVCKCVRCLVNPSPLVGPEWGAGAGLSVGSWSASDCLRACVWIRQHAYCLWWAGRAEVCLHALEIERQLRVSIHTQGWACPAAPQLQTDWKTDHCLVPGVIAEISHQNKWLKDWLAHVIVACVGLWWPMRGQWRHYRSSHIKSMSEAWSWVCKMRLPVSSLINRGLRHHSCCNVLH